MRVFPVALRHCDSESILDSKVTTLEKSVSEIQHTESKLCEIMKSVEIQLEKHQKAIIVLVNDHKATQDSVPSNLVPAITDESVANITTSITAEQKEKVKRQLNIIVHNIKETIYC